MSCRRVSGCKHSSPLWGSNPRPYAYEAHALPTELRRHWRVAKICIHAITNFNSTCLIRTIHRRVEWCRADQCHTAKHAPAIASCSSNGFFSCLPWAKEMRSANYRCGVRAHDLSDLSLEPALPEKPDPKAFIARCNGWKFVFENKITPKLSDLPRVAIWYWGDELISTKSKPAADRDALVLVSLQIWKPGT